MSARKIGYTLLIVGALILVAATACAYVAIWTHGPDCSRFGGTAALSAFIGSASAFLGAILSDPES